MNEEKRIKLFKSLLYPRQAFRIGFEDFNIQEVTLREFNIIPNSGASVPTCEITDPASPGVRIRCSCDMVYVDEEEALTYLAGMLREGIDGVKEALIEKQKETMDEIETYSKRLGEVQLQLEEIKNVRARRDTKEKV